MQFRTGTAAILALAIAMPVQAQTNNLPQLPPGGLDALKAVEQKCHELARPYMGGMLAGKISLLDEDGTQAMLANETYPSAAEAALLRGYLVALRKCEALQHEFIQANAPWDLPTADFIARNEGPIYEALASRKITFGVANRRLYDVAATASAIRKKNWPQVATAQIDNARTAAARAALKQVDAHCVAQLAPFNNGVLQGKTPLGGEAISPVMLAYDAVPNDAEVEALVQLLAVRKSCWADLYDYIRTYAPPSLARLQAEEAGERAVFEALIARKLSFAQANRQFAAVRNASIQQARSENRGVAAPDDLTPLFGN